MAPHPTYQAQQLNQAESQFSSHPQATNQVQSPIISYTQTTSNSHSSINSSMQYSSNKVSAPSSMTQATFPADAGDDWGDWEDIPDEDATGDIDSKNKTEFGQSKGSNNCQYFGPPQENQIITV